MSRRAFLSLLIVTVAAAGAAAWVLSARDTGAGVRGEGRPMFPHLAAHANDVRRVRVTRSTGTATLERTKKGDTLAWSLKELHGYPVPIESLRAVVGGMASVAAIEAKTTLEKKYPKIRVSDPEKKGSKSALVELFDGGGAKMAELIVGLERPSLGGPGLLYVRRPNEARAWLARGKIPVFEKRRDWVDRMIVEIDLPRMREATLWVPGEPPLRVYKNNPDERDFTLENMPKGTELKELFGAEDIARSMQQLSFEEVRPESEIGFDFSARPRGRHITFDGVIVETWMKEKFGKKWVAVRARVNPNPAPVDKVDEAKAGKDVAKINRTAKGWAYTLSDFETQNLSETMETLVQPIPGSAKTN